jgi:hypothetical protein
MVKRFGFIGVSFAQRELECYMWHNYICILVQHIKVECNTRCHWTCLSSILTKCEQYFLLTLESFKRVLLNPTSMWSCSIWQINLLGTCNLLGCDLNVQQIFFKLIMKSNVIQAKVRMVDLVTNTTQPLFINPFICLSTFISFFKNKNWSC